MNQGMKRVLLICADDGTAALVQAVLDGLEAAFVRKDSMKAGMDALREQPYAVVVLATAEGEKGWVQGIAGITERSPGIPVLAVVPEGTLREDDACRVGAYAYMEQDDFLSRALALSLRHAFLAAGVRVELEQSADAVAMVRKLGRIGQWEYDFTAEEGWWSPECLAMFGMDENAGESVEFSQFLRGVHPDDVKDVELALQNSLETGRRMDVAFRYLRGDQSLSHIRCVGEPLQDESGGLARMSGIVRDDTRDWQAGAELERRYTQMQNAQEVLRIGSWDVDADGTFLWSEGLLRVFGCRPGDITSLESLRQFVHPEDREIYEQANRASIHDGWPVDFEYRIIRPDGELRYLHLHRRVELDNAGKVVRAYGTARDITSQKHFETALHKRDTILQAVSQAAVTFLSGKGWEEETGHVIEALGRAMDAEMAFVFCNEVSAGELTSVITHDWYGAEFSGKDKELVRRHPYSKGHDRWVELLGARKAIMGHIRRFPALERELFEIVGAKSVMVVPVFVDETWWGGICMAACQAERDWTPAELESLQLAAEILGNAIHRGRMEQTLLEANLSAEESQKDAEEANKAKSMFLANMSHEIRTPISGIIGLTEMTITTGLKPEQRTNLNMIRDAARSLLNLVNDILDISKIEAQKLVLAPADFNFRKAMDRMVKPFLHQAGKKGLELEMDILDDVPEFVNGDEDRLAQVIRNLLSNALKFTDKGGVDIHIETERKEKGRTCLLFRVSDTGMGIPPGMLDHIFETFAQLDSSAHKKHQGTGLGLAICRELVALMDGDIEVSSRVDRGSVFTFRAWFGEAEQEEKPVRPEAALPTTLHLDILLAEDNELNQKFLTHFLSMFGHTVTLARNGHEVLDLLRQKKGAFDLILMDIQMPEMGGIEAAERIRSSGGRLFDKNIPIIALTAYAMKGDRDRILGAGINEHVTKPVDMAELSAAIFRTVQQADRKAAPRRSARSPLVRPALDREVGFKLNTQALMERFKGNDELLVEILDIFLKESEEKLDQINDAWSRQAASELAMGLHSVSNILSHVHALDIMAESRQMEKWVLQGRMDLAGNGLRGFKQRFRQVVDAVRNFRRDFD